ncbi:hypothetical protein [Photobacterium atrarenae]|uniref:Uncharacterized protein n=1 Tax=Photobacterium atrarenae TaxID=865757 RepID=A0ABY5GNX8_9GAMM|nr:hypothetical protein [Photobacterium atrarenae]UTV30505.1 hypothetical protein NNL38_18195 [Photobacterium atrarenae]
MNLTKIYPLALCLISASSLAAENSIVSMAKESGVKRCVTQLESVANFIIEDKSHGTHANWNSNNPDNRIYTTLTSKGYSDGDSHVSVVSTINSEGKCDAYYTETFALPKSCMLVREQTYKELDFQGTLNGKTIVLKNSGGANYYLSPQGTSGNICLVTKRETIYQ